MSTGTAIMLEPIGRTYGELARGFVFPDPQFWSAAEGKRLRDLASACEADDALREAAETRIPERTREQREAEYLATFEHGAVPLYEGLCRGAAGRFGIQEEVLRFYHHFGVRLSEAARDYPDHFATELEFMEHLVMLEMAAPDNEAVRALQRAQRDFLQRHVLAWAEQLPELVAARGKGDAYRLLALWTQAFARAHLAYLNQALADA